MQNKSPSNSIGYILIILRIASRSVHDQNNIVNNCLERYVDNDALKIYSS